MTRRTGGRWRKQRLVFAVESYPGETQAQIQVEAIVLLDDLTVKQKLVNGSRRSGRQRPERQTPARGLQFSSRDNRSRSPWLLAD